MSAPLITCGFTAYNAAGSIERAIQSALMQIYTRLEIVVVDDASTDETQNILQRLASKHSAIRVFRHAVNAGVAAARNRILEEARGDFVAFFDDDDESVPSRLSVQLERILEYEQQFAHGAPVLCHAARLIQYPSGKQQIWRALGELAETSAPSGQSVALAVLGAGPPPPEGHRGAAATCSQMARLSVYRALGGFDREFRRSEDDDLIVRAAIAGAHFVGISTPLVLQTLTATSDKSLVDQRYFGLKLLLKHKSFLGKSYSFAHSYYEARFALMARRYLELTWRIMTLFMSHPFIMTQRLSGAFVHIGLHRRMGRVYAQAGKQL